MLAVFAAFIVSCDLMQTDKPSEGTGKLVVSITDAPFPKAEVTEVIIHVDKVEMRIAGGLCETEEGETVGKSNKEKKNQKHDFNNFDCDSGFVTVFSSQEAKKIDLFKLQNGIKEVLAESTIPAGSYDMIRLHIIDSYVVTPDDTFDVKVPSGYASGMKIRLDTILVVEEGESISEILLDVDLSRSYHAIGNDKGKKGFKGFIFNPVIRAVVHHHTGSIYGTVYEGESTPVENAMITVLQADTVVTTALSGHKGKYKVIGLPAGTYSLKAEKEGYVTKEMKDIKVVPKGEFKADFQLVKQ